MSNYVYKSRVESILHAVVKLKNKTCLVPNFNLMCKTEDCMYLIYMSITLVSLNFELNTFVSEFKSS